MRAITKLRRVTEKSNQETPKVKVLDCQSELLKSSPNLHSIGNYSQIFYMSL